MKIGESTSKTTDLREISGHEPKKVADSNGANFKRHLKEFDNRNHEERIRALVSQIEEQGKKLSQKVDVRELKIYKRLISDFLDEVLHHSHMFSKDSYLDRRGRYKVYATVKKINAELDELTKEVLDSEGDNINILQRIEDIRGLVLDLML
ncbi:MAG TPA: YaaR family protein [Acetivibrio sp.]|uniref:YaaR family protein n=1 Tax=Acetivibrio sp. TaxID=1872092 RepID=UPI002BC01678|nr:YaaR family protein [Acetivibrio sp.]HOM02504.1 YaaR family protein [Acetivibrio sp.]